MTYSCIQDGVSLICIQMGIPSAQIQIFPSLSILRKILIFTGEVPIYACTIGTHHNTSVNNIAFMSKSQLLKCWKGLEQASFDIPLLTQDFSNIFCNGNPLSGKQVCCNGFLGFFWFACFFNICSLVYNPNSKHCTFMLW